LTETDRDDALNDLVTALNAAAGETRWAFAPTPPPAELPEVAEQDVIRNAFIYDPATVELVGESDVLTGSAAFANAREPLAQAFKASGGADEDAFGVIVNHFKSKGSGVDDGTGQGNANPDRIAQAEGLSAFADEFALSRGTEAVFLTGDFNSYSKEDPMQVLYADGYTKLESDTAGETSYSFSGLSGSLDHVLANPAALGLVTGVDIWETNANESVAFQYSRFNYNITQFFEGDNPFAASDHNPEIVGLDVADVVAIEEIQILGTNDFHGRIQNNSSNGEAGAAVLAGAVKQLRAQNPSTVFAAAGDLIGASTFESFIAQDKPTIDALNEAGLEVSAVGNHEFDQGYDDLVNRVMAPYDETTNPYGGAEWEYLGANVRFRDGGGPALPESWIQDFGDVEVGFVGAVTEHLDELVSPAGIEDIEVTSVVAAANTTADELRADGADIVVLLVHEGATTTSLASATDPTSDFGQIVLGVDEDIDAIVSGHTHLAYNHAIPVQQWIDEGRPVTTRPVVSAGQYGTNLNQLLYDVDTTTGQLLGVEQNILALKTGQTANYPSDPATAQIVADAVAEAAVLGAEPLGEIGGPFNRAKLANGTTENRGGESTLGNLVAEVQRWATASATTGSAQIAFMNPGGLRADLVGTVADGYPETVTFKQAANVQPFANTLVNMDLTGAQVKQALEQQWQPAGSSRPFLRLGISEGFTYTYDPNAAAGSRITDMWLDGEDIDPAATYSVTVNSFLASGGDNFGVFNAGTGKQDTGQTDLEAMVDYMDANSPVPVDYTQRSVGVSFPAGAPDEYPQGGEVSFNLSSLAFSTAPDLKDANVEVSLDGTSLGTFPVDNTIGTAVFDEYGTAAVTVTLPQNTPPGEVVLTVTGTTTGTETMVPITVSAPEPVPSSVTATAADMVYGTDGEVVATVTPAAATGEVEVFDGETSLGSAPVTAGVASITIDGTALEIGSHVLDVRYSGGPGFEPSETTVQIDVAKATPTMTISRSPAEVAVRSGKVTLTVDVSAEGYQPGGVVGAYVTGNLVGLGTVSPEGVAEFEVGPFRKRGTVTIDIVYFGDEHTLGAEGTTTVTVVKK
ncbi:MAG: 5'-nucleotidase C-terminal domain-containing protein, partial [Ilumatobacteraceae bacterium]